ncbi:uncharacterized protein L203_102747 [Cryptococcus depauperatus CBS 7841]|uniref:Uncharacterized protein n=1 Tax=Cryptococcus depauperatus CBS 7841 TaxID=1295531 RepID=A0AAJ8JSE4_9TREE
MNRKKSLVRSNRKGKGKALPLPISGDENENEVEDGDKGERWVGYMFLVQKSEQSERRDIAYVCRREMASDRYYNLHLIMENFQSTRCSLIVSRYVGRDDPREDWLHDYIGYAAAEATERA